MYSPAKDLKIERNIGRFADINQYTGLRLKTSFGRSTQLIKPFQKSAQLPLTNILWEERFDFSFTSKRFFRVSRFYTINMTTLPVSGPL